jgi:hypothetical protein
MGRDGHLAPDAPPCGGSDRFGGFFLAWFSRAEAEHPPVVGDWSAREQRFELRAPEGLALEQHARHDVKLRLTGLQDLGGDLVRGCDEPADLVVDVAGGLL